MAFEDWVVYSIAAMACFSISNLFVKMLVSNQQFSKVDYSMFIAPAALVAIGVAIGLFFAYQNLTPQLFSYVLAILIFTLVGFSAFAIALKTGKVAIVTAILSLSTIFIALLSYQFLGDKFNTKEILAMLFAVLSLLTLVL